MTKDSSLFFNLSEMITKNQYIAYGWLLRGKAAVVEAVGTNAVQWDIPIYSALKAKSIVQMWVNDPAGQIVTRLFAEAR